MSAAVSAMGARLEIAIGDVGVTSDPNAVVETIGLGSCIGVAVWDRRRRIGGMLHYMLALSSTAPARAKERPAMFCDTGVPLLFKSMYELGAEKGDLIVRVAGGSSLNSDAGLFQIGKRNVAVLQKMFQQNGIRVAAEDVGGQLSRTLRLYVGDGRVTVSSPGREIAL